MGAGIPQQAVGASVAVLIYSFFCLTCSSLLVGLLLSYGESWTYVTLISSFTAISTVASIIQQFHYAFAWEVIKQAQFDEAVKSLTSPALALGGSAQSVDVVLFDIQFYCYNAMALNVLFWSVALFCGSWGIRSNWLGDWHERVSPISKVVGIFLPAIVVGLSHASAAIHNTALFFVITTITLLGSLTIGTVLLVLILYKYMQTRRLLAGAGRRGGWWASGGLKERSRNRDIGADGTIESGVTSNTQRSIYDRALMTRFTIGFVILAIFEVVIIVFSLFQQSAATAIAKSGVPNHKVSSTISDILFFIPGVTASLVDFLVFGTTKSWRQYRDLVVGGCGIRSRIYEKRIRRSQEGNSDGLEFERLPSLPNRKSEDNAIKAEKRVRMFVTSLPPEKESAISTPSNAAPSSSEHTRGPSAPRNTDIQTPGFVDISKSLPSSTSNGPQSTSAVAPVGLAYHEHQDDPVIQSEPVDEEHGQGRDAGSRRSSKIQQEGIYDDNLSMKRNNAWPAVRNWEAEKDGNGLVNRDRGKQYMDGRSGVGTENKPDSYSVQLQQEAL